MIIAWGGERNPRDNALMALWAARIIWPHRRYDFGNCVTMGVIENERLIGVMVFHNYDPDAGTIEISGASTSKRWLNRKTLKAMFDYPFRQLGLNTVVMRCDADKRHLSRMLKAYGFSEHIIPHLGAGGQDLHVYVLTREAWAGNKFNRKAEPAH